MKDPEFIKLRNRFFMALLVALVFTIPMFLFIINKFDEKPSKIIAAINKQENLLILVTSENCSTCLETKNILKENNTPYYELNKDTEKNVYEKMLQKIALSNDDVTSPTLIYLEKGKLASSLVTPPKEELLDYLEYNQFTTAK